MKAGRGGGRGGGGGGGGGSGVPQQSTSDDTPTRGVVARWVQERGFGFLRSASDAAEVFAHSSDCAALLACGTPSPGDAVEYRVSAMGDGRVKAVDVQPVGRTGEASASASAPQPPSTQQPRQPHRSIVFAPNGRVAAVSLFLVRCHPDTGDDELLLCRVPKKSAWESGGYFIEPTQKCPFDGSAPLSPAAALQRSSLGADDRNASARALRVVTGLLRLPDVSDMPHTSAFTSTASPTQMVFARLPAALAAEWTPPDTVVAAAAAAASSTSGDGDVCVDDVCVDEGLVGGERAEADDAAHKTLYDTLRWFSLTDVAAKATSEKILQHTEQRAHYVEANRKVRESIGLKVLPAAPAPAGGGGRGGSGSGSRGGKYPAALLGNWR